jgi:pyruvate dehydrogenase E2 component (dihydrolipoamide acetyltransferase)
MATPILLPQQGNTVETCRLLEWRKKKGEHVNKGEVVCEVETDKSMFEIDSPEDGVLLEQFFKEGDDIPVLTNIAVVGKPGDDYTEFLPGKPDAITGAQKDVVPSEGDLNAKSEEPHRDGTIITKEIEANRPSEKKGISPRAAALAEQSVLETQRIRGTGPGGRIIERDVLAHVASPKPTPLVSVGSDDDIEVVPLQGVRKLIAERMLRSIQDSAQLTLNSAANARNLLEVRKNFKSNPEYQEFSAVTINDLVHFAVIQVLPRHPALNSWLQDDKVFYFKNIHLGFAVDTARGLMVPVIKNAHTLKLLELSKEAKRLATQCNNSRILADELSGGTFTVTNLGNFSIESFTPVLNLPQTAILGVNAIAPKPVDDGNGVEFLPHISFSLTIDHRVIDGATGAKFLQDLSKTIANISLTAIGVAIVQKK